MNVDLTSLVPFGMLKEDQDEVLSIADRNGKVVLLKNNQPAYIILKYDSQIFDEHAALLQNDTYTLHEAMKIVLQEEDSRTMHAAKLAEEIFNRKLYLKKNGQKAEYTQIRARVVNYPDLFTALPGNLIKLRDRFERKPII